MRSQITVSDGVWQQRCLLNPKAGTAIEQGLIACFDAITIHDARTVFDETKPKAEPTVLVEKLDLRADVPTYGEALLRAGQALRQVEHQQE